MNDQLQTLEGYRKKVTATFKWALVLVVGGLPLVFIGLGLLYVVCFLAGIVLLVFVRSKREGDYKEYFKDTFVRSLLQNMIPGSDYEPKNGFPREFIRGTGLMLMGSIYNSEDYIKGTYNGVAFERADVVIEDESTDSDGNTTTTTYLRGRWMVFESNKDFSADLQIVQKGFGYANRRKSIFVKKVDRRHEFQTEDEEFNKKFQCLCQNESEAFYLLTPGIMQGLMKLAAEADGKIMVGFVDNRLHVVVNSRKDSLEPPIFRAFSEKDFEEVKREFYAITSFVETVNLDRKIFK
jgi:hypothetical protein